MKQLGWIPCISHYESVWGCVLQRRWRLHKTVCTAGSRSLWQESGTLNLQPNTKRTSETPKLWKQMLQMMFTWRTPPPIWPVRKEEIQTETVVLRNRMGGGQMLFQSRNWWGSLWVAQDLCGHLKSYRTEIRDANMSFFCDSTRLSLFSLRDRETAAEIHCAPPGSKR